MSKRGPDPEYTTEDALAVFNNRQEACEPLSTQEVADELGCSGSMAYELLTELTEENKIASKKIGARARAWWIPEDNETK